MTATCRHCGGERVNGWLASYCPTCQRGYPSVEIEDLAIALRDILLAFALFVFVMGTTPVWMIRCLRDRLT